MLETKSSLRKKLGAVEPEIIYRLFYPQVPVIICAKAGKTIAGMPASSFISVSNKPAMVVLSLSRKIQTLSVIKSSRLFSANWLSYGANHRRHILKLAEGSEGDDKLARKNVPYFLEKKTPFLSSADAQLLCLTKRIVKCGDHDLIIASVLLARASGDFLRERYWSFRKYKPFLYLGSSKREPLSTINLPK